jgi:hypothetical protein
MYVHVSCIINLYFYIGLMMTPMEGRNMSPRNLIIKGLLNTVSSVVFDGLFLSTKSLYRLSYAGSLFTMYNINMHFKNSHIKLQHTGKNVSHLVSDLNLRRVVAFIYFYLFI